MYHHVKKENPFLRKALYETYQKKCVYCGDILLPKNMQIDHILPTNAIKPDDPELEQYLTELRAKGFDTEHPDYIENYFPCCANCNLRKNNRSFKVENLRYYHDMAEKKTKKVLSLMKKYEAGTDVSDFTPEPDESLTYLEPDLKKYILQKFEDYKTQNISVWTPQLLLMLLTYPGNDIVEIFDVYKTKDGHSYGRFLIDSFRDIDEQYKTDGQTYREKDWTAFMRMLKNAEEVLRSQKYEEYITANILCYTILNYWEGATVAMIRDQIGDTCFRQLKMYVLAGRTPSIYA